MPALPKTLGLFALAAGATAHDPTNDPSMGSCLSYTGGEWTHGDVYFNDFNARRRAQDLTNEDACTMLSWQSDDSGPTLCDSPMISDFLWSDLAIGPPPGTNKISEPAMGPQPEYGSGSESPPMGTAFCSAYNPGEKGPHGGVYLAGGDGSNGYGGFGVEDLTNEDACASLGESQGQPICDSPLIPECFWPDPACENIPSDIEALASEKDCGRISSIGNENDIASTTSTSSVFGPVHQCHGVFEPGLQCDCRSGFVGIGCENIPSDIEALASEKDCGRISSIGSENDIASTT
eukprot:COSAG05_NODE_3252_length_2203_cov_13.660646_1_plen_291_part_10